MTDIQTYGQNGTTAPAAPLDLSALDPAALAARGAAIPWGDQPHQTSSPVIASGMLRLLRARNPQLWAELHYEAATGEPLALSKPRAPRKPK